MSTAVPIGDNYVKASASHAAGQCVALKPAENGTVLVKHSGASIDSPVLAFTRAEFAAFLDGAKAGEFDHLA